jgi:hypothetical protein
VKIVIINTKLYEMRATYTGEICIIDDDGAGGFENFERGIEGGGDWRGGRVIGEVNEVARNAEAFAPEGGEFACGDVVGDDLEGDSGGVIVVRVLTSDGVEEIGSAFNSAGQRADSVLALGNGDNKAAGCQADRGLDADGVVNVGWGED